MLIVLLLLAVGAGAVYRATTAAERTRFLEEYLQPAAVAIDEVFFATGPFRATVTARTPRIVVTPVIAGLNLLLFARMFFDHGYGSEAAALLAWGASDGPSTTNGEWWRLVTAVFLQPGPFHLLFTLIGFAQIGELLERLVGPFLVAAVYLIAGTLGTLASLSMSPLGVHAGASAAICGLYGLFVIVTGWTLTRKGGVRIPLAVFKTLAPGVVTFLLYTLLSFEVSSTAAGIGFLVGLAAGVTLTIKVGERRPSLRLQAFALAPAVGVIVYLALPLRGIVDIRPELVAIVSREDRTADMYRAAVGRFTRHQRPVDTRVLLDLIDGTILPQLGSARVHVDGLSTPLADHQPLVAGAAEYLRLRETSWRLRADALRKRSMNTLREAERVEHASFNALKPLRGIRMAM